MIIDLTIIFFYFLIVFLLGLKFSKSNQSESDFYLAKKEIHWSFLMISLVATETSSLTFLSIPSLAIKTDFRFLEIAIGYIIGRTAVAYFLLPFYFAGNGISIYEYLNQNFGLVTQRTVSFIFTISRLLGDGIRLYVSALPISFLLQKMGVSMDPEWTGMLSLFILSLVTIVYSVVGGFRAIVFTDVLQWLVYITGGFFALYLLFQFLFQTGEDLSTIIQNLSNQNKFQVFHFGIDSNSDPNYFFLFAILGGAFISIGSHGTDLMLVQRVIATKNLNSARKVLIGSGILVFFQFVLFLSIGSLLFYFYKNNLPPADKAFSQFIIDYVPTPILGLLVSAILASAMSTLSSTINSLSLTWARDWNLDKMFRPRGISLFFGILLFLSSLLPFFLAKDWEKGILEVGLTIFSFTLGPTIFVFFLAQFQRKLAISSWFFSFLLLFSIFITVGIGHSFKIPFTLLIPMGFAITASLVFSTDSVQRLIRKTQMNLKK
ncbi:MAG: sodium:solute symporter [Leptospira sp.]|nr:sodium:solute symporter [Leptospira sp.]